MARGGEEERNEGLGKFGPGWSHQLGLSLAVGFRTRVSIGPGPNGGREKCGASKARCVVVIYIISLIFIKEFAFLYDLL